MIRSVRLAAIAATVLGNLLFGGKSMKSRSGARCGTCEPGGVILGLNSWNECEEGSLRLWKNSTGYFPGGSASIFARQVGPQDLDDKVHDLFLTIIQSIQRGDLREPERLMGYVRTIVRRQVAAHIDDVVQARTEPDRHGIRAGDSPDFRRG